MSDAGSIEHPDVLGFRQDRKGVFATLATMAKQVIPSRNALAF
ncbi:hypothetical protein USDA257_c48280 [Sinorhizobium fredii USDA 257]|uniref:Uncharacterized protein n=1 Tax=Sinorhizobium fredii (strain USDA 257) TaxID=1185652 RepID=I3XBV7_SINF2|nr:hypothetical protein USDA257_c48280 [Sinorhizobium fredii USDA 257]